MLLDTDWRTFAWRAADDRRSQAVLDAWEERCPHPRIGSELEPLLRAAGFTVDAVVPVPIVERTLEDGFFGRNLPFLVEHAAGHETVGLDDAEAWREDVLSRDACGETLVSLTQFCYVARAPSSH